MTSMKTSVKCSGNAATTNGCKCPSCVAHDKQAAAELAAFSLRSARGAAWWNVMEGLLEAGVLTEAEYGAAWVAA